MYKKKGQFYYSPSDLTRYMESPFVSWMDRFAIEHPKLTPKKNSAHTFMNYLVQKGYEHEDALESSLIEQGFSLMKINGTSANKKYADTLEAMYQGIDVISQARLELEQFIGYADFLVKVQHAEDLDSLLGNWHYEIWDTKLSDILKPTFAIQLCCYSQMLESMQGYLPKFITVTLGNNRNECLRISDFYYYYQKLRSSFIVYQDNFNSDKMPDPADSRHWGDWSAFAEFLMVDGDHLLLVATITKGQIKKLNQVGIETMHILANSSCQNVLGINTVVLAKLKAQAAVQKCSAGNSVPQFEIIKPGFNEKSGLALLPPHSLFDVFFDIEGYPFYEGGLEYLWGNTYFDNEGNRQFVDFWAHNEGQEKQAFQDFIYWVYERWQQDPKMHIYHYANYEIAACRKLMSRYGVCEYEVDQLLRNKVFIDLYKIVKGSILLGEPRYSIKNVEHLYRCKRETRVSNGSDSIVAYEQWRTLNKRGAQGGTWQTSEILNGIRNYNIDDCKSTQELVNWLRRQQVKNSISYFEKTEVAELDMKEEVTERTLLRDRLLTRSSSELKTNPKQAALTENLAWVLEFHRREAKPIFWRLFERLELSYIELIDDLDCLAHSNRTERKPFRPTSHAHNLAYEYYFDPTQGIKGIQKQFY
ncbi:MAG: TM0106 family RecB-like putative nuclease [Moritella sp.]|uniref:TM0106 family RecB-like putative nuclease n=1 Tax=Moritella sp. TaxID=78556 RepID=UPI001E197DA9|nr:TM0106 family RecB-like putative nuclease [Moritella sp.]NQZ52429.1 TM0106 family RecB-like putative nuclease [Moritella sp.]